MRLVGVNFNEVFCFDRGRESNGSGEVNVSFLFGTMIGGILFRAKNSDKRV